MGKYFLGAAALENRRRMGG